MNIESGGAKLVLLCPAWKKWGTARTVKTNTVTKTTPAGSFLIFTNDLGQAVTNKLTNAIVKSETKITGDDDEEVKDDASVPSVDVTLEEGWRILRDLIELTKGNTFAGTTR